MVTDLAKGGEIGVGITRSFAVAGSTQIAIVGRWQEVLASTARELENPFKGPKVLTCIHCGYLQEITDRRCL